MKLKVKKTKPFLSTTKGKRGNGKPAKNGSSGAQCPEPPCTAVVENEKIKNKRSKRKRSEKENEKLSEEEEKRKEKEEEIPNSSNVNEKECEIDEWVPGMEIPGPIPENIYSIMQENFDLTTFFDDLQI